MSSQFTAEKLHPDGSGSNLCFLEALLESFKFLDRVSGVSAMELREMTLDFVLLIVSTALGSRLNLDLPLLGRNESG
jgi:hypothetical protein